VLTKVARVPPSCSVKVKTFLPTGRSGFLVNSSSSAKPSSNAKVVGSWTVSTSQ